MTPSSLEDRELATPTGVPTLGKVIPFVGMILKDGDRLQAGDAEVLGTRRETLTKADNSRERAGR